jgi:formylglycine-generating enzyme required for sulfatase activity
MTQIERELSRAFHKTASAVVDPGLTEHREAVAAAVRGASTHRAPESAPPSFGSMSTADFRNEVKSRYGFDPM